MRGEYLVYNKGGLVKDIIPNTVVQQGQLRIYQSVFNNASVGMPMGTMEIALIDEVPSYLGLIAAITTEPTVQGGYARQPLLADTANWTVDTINSEGRVTSATVTFTATGADFSRPYSRFMLVEQGAELVSYSSPIDSPTTVLTGQSVLVAYRMYTG